MGVVVARGSNGLADDSISQVVAMFRFTIRDVLWLTVVVALVVGWWLDRARLDSEREAVKAKQRELDAQFLRLVHLTDELHRRVQASASP